MMIAQALIERAASGRYVIAQLTLADFVAAQAVRERYAGLQLDLADAIGVVIAHTYRTDKIFTLDQRDFRAITPLTPGIDHYVILPADG